MQITIFGAAGKIGQRVVVLALEAGYEVVAVTHQATLDHLSHENLRTTQADVHEEAQVTAAIQGSSVVISCLGSWHTPTKDVLTAATKALIPAMEQQGIRRLITLTGAGALDEQDTPDLLQKLSHVGMKIVAGKVLEDAEQHLRLLRASSLDWTVIRSPVMNNRGSEHFILSLKLPDVFATIHRQAVANCICEQIVSTDFIHQAPVITRQ